MVVVHHLTAVEAEVMAVAIAVAATEIPLDLEGSLPGGRCHYCTTWRPSPTDPEKTVLARRIPGA